MSDAAAASDRTNVPALLGIIVKPRATMRAILDRRARRATVPLVLAAFFATVMPQIDWRRIGAAALQMGSGWIAGVLALAIVICCVIALVGYLLFSVSAVMAGRFLGGSGSFSDVRTAVAWGVAPLVWAFLYRIPAMIFWYDAYRAIHAEQEPLLEMGRDGLHLALSGPTEASLPQIVILGGLDLLLLGAYLFVGSTTLGEAHRVSSMHGLGTLLMMLVMPIALLLMIALAVVLAT